MIPYCCNITFTILHEKLQDILRFVNCCLLSGNLLQYLKTMSYYVDKLRIDNINNIIPVNNQPTLLVMMNY